ncbi:NHL repeat-containing protein [Hamadaea tsunoensis]|uniref:hypothetical protein n=1 Tax=Hamadaea tsunoensis TaxID=53368 RepID=UPI000550C0CE|nr:hypothetical protein [Hamadaea tsunoensis]
MAAFALLLPGAPAAARPAAEPGKVLCEVHDERAGELSGLVVTATGYISIDDSNFDPSAIRIFYFDRKCKLTRTVRYPTAARDPEDVALARDGTLWVADIGDNFDAKVRRSTIALWTLAPGGKTPVIHRLTYPDGPHDAEALLLDSDGTPIIVTKDLSAVSEIYVPAQPLRANTAEGVPLTKVGSLRLPESQTSNFLGGIGRRLVTGGAVSPDGRHVVLRTYADALEWDVGDGGVLGALTSGTDPRVTPLPDEPQGEGIAYTLDGAGFVTACDEPFGQASALRAYVPAARPSPSPSVSAEGAAAGPGTAVSRPVDRVLFGAGAVGLLLVVVGLGGMLFRRLLR